MLVQVDTSAVNPFVVAVPQWVEEAGHRLVEVGMIPVKSTPAAVVAAAAMLDVGTAVVGVRRTQLVGRIVAAVGLGRSRMCTGQVKVYRIRKQVGVGIEQDWTLVRSGGDRTV